MFYLIIAVTMLANTGIGDVEISVKEFSSMKKCRAAANEIKYRSNSRFHFETNCVER